MCRLGKVRKYLIQSGDFFDSKLGKYKPLIAGKVEQIFGNGDKVMFATVDKELYSYGEGPIGREETKDSKIKFDKCALPKVQMVYAEGSIATCIDEDG